MAKYEDYLGNIGHGGYKCHCCGPVGKERPAHRRRVRHRLKAETTRMISAELGEEFTTVSPREYVDE